MNNIKILIGVVVVLLIGGLFLFYKPSTAPAPYGQSTGGTNPTAPAPTTGGTGSKGTNVIFTFKDKALSLEGLQSVVMQVKEISVLTPKQGWVPVITSPMSFDLLQLKKESYLQALSEIHLNPGTYNQIWFVVDSVLITQNNIPKMAKLPSGELKILTNLVVEEKKTTAVVMDFLVDQSLHITGDNKYIFAPTINLKTITGVQVQKIGTHIDLIGGTEKFTGDLGMDEAGNFGPNLSIDPSANLDVVNDLIVVTPKDIDQTKLVISVETAMADALNQKYADRVLSVKADVYYGRTVWRVLGAKNYGTVKVYVDGMTGNIIGVEYQNH